MENRSEKKTKAQIEKETPFIHPKDCPGAIIAWVQDRDEENFRRWRTMLREELKPIRRFMRMATGNRIWLIILSAIVMFIGFALFYHLLAR